MELGNYNRLRILRETDLAWMLADGDEEVFLHKKEADRSYAVGDEVEVFLYADSQGRIAATTARPYATTTTAAFLEVVSVNHEFGVFLANGIAKDLLLSKDDLPLSTNYWPVVGDRLFCTVKAKKGLLFAKVVGRKVPPTVLRPDRPLEGDTATDAIVSHFIVDGLILVTEQGHEIFVHENNMRRKYRLGETVNVRILKINPDGEAVGTLIQQKEMMLQPDADAILRYLENHAGRMRFTDASAPEEIQAAFHMSKSAFKRALGTLYREGRVELRPDATILK
ncbi:MAG: S1-like domain-containing RNA-binding protein [Candidatus Izemoplasmatales bacterium]